MKLIHTADIHLGAKLNFLGDKASKQRANISETFQNTISLALKEKVDVFLLAGDLFDSNNPANTTLLMAIAELKKLIKEGIYVALIPGNHDYLNKSSIYNRAEFNSLKANEYFHIFESDDISNWHIEQLDLVIYAAAVTRSKQAASQIKDYNKIDAKYQIGMFHGSVDLMGPVTNYPLPVAKLKELDVDYIALGDWHSQLMVIPNKPACYYAGSPEVIASDQKGAGKVLMVEMNSGKVEVNSIDVGKTKIANIEIDISSIKDAGTLIDKVLSTQKADANILLNLVIKGTMSLDNNIEFTAVTEHLQNEFFHVNLVDNTDFEISQDEIDRYSKHFVISKYIEFIEGFKKENPEQIDIADTALRKGLQLLISRQQTNEAN